MKNILKANFSTPWFCPHCESIRGIDSDEATNMHTLHQSLMWQSFQMCAECYTFQRDHPDQVEENKKKYAEKLVAKEKKIQEIIASQKYRVYFWDKNEKFPDYSYAKVISGADFFKYGKLCEDTENCKYKTGAITKSKFRFSLEDADRIVEDLKNKGFDSWHEIEED